VALLALLLLAPPLALATFVGWPLPTAIPTLDAVEMALRSGVSDSIIVRGLALIGWAAWCQVALAIAVEVAKRHEVGEGRKPVSVEEENCGWDLTSLAGGEVERYIEVKGRAGVGDVALTPNEWIKAQRFGDQYWLYVVVNCKTNPELHLIQNPAAKLTPKEEVSVVRYIVGQSNWRQASE